MNLQYVESLVTLLRSSLLFGAALWSFTASGADPEPVGYIYDYFPLSVPRAEIVEMQTSSSTRIGDIPVYLRVGDRVRVKHPSGHILIVLGNQTAIKLDAAAGAYEIPRIESRPDWKSLFRRAPQRRDTEALTAGVTRERPAGEDQSRVGTIKILWSTLPITSSEEVQAGDELVEYREAQVRNGVFLFGLPSDQARNKSPVIGGLIGSQKAIGGRTSPPSLLETLSSRQKTAAELAQAGLLRARILESETEPGVSPLIFVKGIPNQIAWTGGSGPFKLLIKSPEGVATLVDGQTEVVQNDLGLKVASQKLERSWFREGSNAITIIDNGVPSATSEVFLGERKFKCPFEFFNRQTADSEVVCSAWIRGELR